MIEVFKTSIYKQKDALQIQELFSEYLPALKINFDLDDCDKILRVEGHQISAQKIIEILDMQGHYCKLLE